LINTKQYTTPNEGIILVNGPTKSGKSQWAEQLLIKFTNVTYIATHSTIYDDQNWIDRIERHKKRRPKKWKLIENYDNLADLLISIPNTESILLDSLGGFINQNIDLKDSDWSKLSSQFIRALIEFKGLIIIVIEEVGWGISPATAIGNLFRDRLGELSLELNELSKDCWLVIQGYSINIKDLGIKVN